ncbi:MAG: LysR family transcriptional regulator, partial [Pontibacterium sp.]
MDIGKIDLNLLVYLDVLLKEQNVTRAAGVLGITQPAMSNGLKRLRDTLNDPLLVRTHEGMKPTERALEIQPLVHQILASVEEVVSPSTEFEPLTSDRVFRILTSDYGEATLMPRLLKRLRREAPNVVLDILTPSDMSYLDVERGQVDLIINRFDSLPQSFHQTTLWRDGFSCLLSATNPLASNFTLQAYLEADHVWVNKTGVGSGTGLTPKDIKRLGWVDEALQKLNKKRHITVFTRHYQSALMLAEQDSLVVTMPSRLIGTRPVNPRLIELVPPFDVPKFDFKMAWSPLLQHNSAHRWLRRLIVDVVKRG